ncbi:hypothetical protein [Dolichospermum compactum]|uniref:Adenylate/guanylate cyclase n=1 Tax=Dolichospermum compactum NIES-806 TaxID=1973481 RepID=A0A1Z4V3E3_9CYAN|nr:hypothetical protein [Dolichospermum compactum]BAZ86051.1 adenylate/guanylate cyclase [Dolichospermum compactum NIES-806]
MRIDSELQVEAKGIKHPINLYEVGGIGGKYQLFLPTEAESMVSLSEELLIEYMILQGKHHSTLNQNCSILNLRFLVCGAKLCNIKPIP